MRTVMLFAALVLTPVSALAAKNDDKAIVCMPVAKAGWEAIVEVFDQKLSGKPKYDAAKTDPSATLLEMAERMPSAEQCAQTIALFGPGGVKALMIKSSREDLAAGKYPRIFD